METGIPITLNFPQDIITPAAERAASSPNPAKYFVWVAPSPETRPTTYTITEILQRVSLKCGGMKRVYRATMHVSAGSLDGTIPVVLKLALGRRYAQDLKREARVYVNKLVPLFGSRVPYCYGVWSGETYEGQTAVMVMQDGGQPLRRSIAHQPVLFRQTIVDHLVAVHRAGVSFAPGHFGEANVVVYHMPDGEFYPMLIDFANADTSHECPYDGNITVYSPKPEDPLPCSELWDAALTAEAYYPCKCRTVQYFGSEVSLDIAKNPAELVKVGKRPDNIPEYLALAHAEHALGELLRWRQGRLDMDQMPVRLQ